MRRIISALFLGFATLTTVSPLVQAATTKPLELAANAPERHIVVTGDTLWDISSKFLKDPFRWPELWQLNKEDIRNPHWIYPGQVLVLDRSGATPRLRTEGSADSALETIKMRPQERIEPAKQVIWSIAPEVIEPFLTRPLVLDESALDGAARVVGIQDNRVIAGSGDRIYATSVGEPTQKWQLFRPGSALIDPETGALLGYEALYLGNARQLGEGNPAEFMVQNSKQEITAGDRLMRAPHSEIINYLPHAPDKEIKGRVLGMAGGVKFAGKNSVISLNRGKADGLELGHVLALDRVGEVIDDRFKGEKTTYQLPDLRNGYVFVFRIFEHVAYGLVMEAKRPVVLGDRAHTP